VWPAALPSFLALKGLFEAEFVEPPGSPSMPQGGPCLGSPGAMSLRTGSAPSCTAKMPAHSVFRSALCGLHLPSDGSSHGGWSRLCMPVLGDSCSGNSG